MTIEEQSVSQNHSQQPTYSLKRLNVFECELKAIESNRVGFSQYPLNYCPRKELWSFTSGQIPLRTQTEDKKRLKLRAIATFARLAQNYHESNRQKLPCALKRAFTRPRRGRGQPTVATPRWQKNDPLKFRQRFTLQASYIRDNMPGKQLLLRRFIERRPTKNTACVVRSSLANEIQRH